MEETTKQAKQYSKRKTQLTIVQLLMSVAFLLIAVLSGGTLFLKKQVTSWSQNFYLQVALYLAIFTGIYYLLFLWLDFYDGYMLEHEFLLSNQTVYGWLKKSMKKGLLSFVLLLVAVEILYSLLRHFPEYWWLLTAAAYLMLTLVLARITPALIIPLFYKCTLLANIPLKERLLRLGQNCGVAVKEVFEVRLSKDTNKANAAVAGFGKARRILLGDTLMNDYSDEEIEAIFAHELGHVRLLHTWKIFGFAAVVSVICFYLTSLLFKAGLGLFALGEIHDIAAFPLLALCLTIVGLVLMPIQHGYLRYLEKQADTFAAKHIEQPQSFTSAMTKLAEQNLSDPSPSRWEEILLYDHPPITKRLQYTKEYMKEQNGSPRIE